MYWVLPAWVGGALDVCLFSASSDRLDGIMRGRCDLDRGEVLWNKPPQSPRLGSTVIASSSVVVFGFSTTFSAPLHRVGHTFGSAPSSLMAFTRAFMFSFDSLRWQLVTVVTAEKWSGEFKVGPMLVASGNIAHSVMSTSARWTALSGFKTALLCSLISWINVCLHESPS